MIIFVRTKNATVDLSEKLEARGYASSPLNGDMNQALREKTIERMKAGKIDILVATDVAARGLDIERMSHVVNYDIPYDTEFYVYCIGRTGRAGRKGEAILFVSPREKRMLGAIEKATKQTITRMQLPSSEDIADRRVMTFKQDLTETIESQDLAFFENLIRQYQEEHNADPIEMAAALAFQVQKTRPLNPPVVHSERKQPRERAERAERGDRPERANRGERGMRSERPPRAERSPRRQASHQAEEGMKTYRIEVGTEQNVEPKHIVGAIANEAGMDSRMIGRITINQDHSLVDLPDGMPKDIFQHLRKVWVNNKQLEISLPDGDADTAAVRSERKPRRVGLPASSKTKKRPAIAAKKAKKSESRLS
jgi:ATP-dependent RNA helicase DeaD